MSKKKPEVRCPHCGGTTFLEHVNQVRWAFICTDGEKKKVLGVNPVKFSFSIEDEGELLDGNHITKTSGTFEYICTDCNECYYACNAEDFQDKLRTICTLLGKLRYVVDYTKLKIESVRVTACDSTHLDSVIVNNRWSDYTPLTKLHKTKKAAREALLKYLKQQMDRTAHVSKEHWKEFEMYEKKYNEVKRSIR